MSSPKGDKYEAFVMDVLKSEIEKDFSSIVMGNGS